MYNTEKLINDINGFRQNFKFLKPTKLNLSISDFANNCNISYTTMYEIIALRKQPTNKSMDKICAILQKNVKEYIL